MTLYDLLGMFADGDQEVSIWDSDRCEVIYEGTADECDLNDYEVCSIDTLTEATTVITINVSKE